MTEKELQEIFELLEKSGMNPLLCDTPVPYYENRVPAGIPSDAGDVTQGEYILLPRSLVGLKPVFVINVCGDSMRDAGIDDGDRLHVQIDTPVSDGDIVLACLDGDLFTVKTLCTDERGEKWLVPRNPEHDAIRMKDRPDARIIGKVVAHTKDAPRVSYRDCEAAIKKARKKEQEQSMAPPTPQQVEAAIRAAADMVKNGRHWYAVYRAVLDRKGIGRGDYAGFVRTVKSVLPNLKHPPVDYELQRMAVQSFSKPVSLWNPEDAPVTGRRFDAYLRIAQAVLEML